MIVDIHTHTFPQAIAASTIEKLAAMSHLTPITHGANPDLAASMAQAGVDRSIVLPVATNPAKVSHINDAAAKVNEDYAHTGIFSFGASWTGAASWGWWCWSTRGWTWASPARSTPPRR